METWNRVYMIHDVYNYTSALTPDGGLINGVGALSQEKYLIAGQHLTVPLSFCLLPPDKICL